MAKLALRMDKKKIYLKEFKLSYLKSIKNVVKIRA